MRVGGINESLSLAIEHNERLCQIFFPSCSIDLMDRKHSIS